MSIAKRPSRITLPSKNQGWPNLLAFLGYQFPLISNSLWQKRLEQNKLHWDGGEQVTVNSPFIPGRVLCYYREVEQEPQIPFEHQILFQNEHILVACKPHFLPVTPGGKYVNECLLERIRSQQDIAALVPMHRLDRETAGLVMFSTNPDTRGLYSSLFADRKIKKSYQAIAQLPTNYLPALPQKWSVANRLVKGNPPFTMQQVEGDANAFSTINLAAIKSANHSDSSLGLFELEPISGKTHQLRLHMTEIGFPILNDKFYPQLQPEQAIDFAKPLQLLAKTLSFIDPVNAELRQFESNRVLGQWQIE